MKNKYFDYFIAGGGIAGLLLAFHLRKAGKSVLLCDEQKTHTSSKIAAGMFNPISGKRMRVNWKAAELLFALQEDFAQMGEMLQQKFLVEAPILQAFGNIKESNDFSINLDSQLFHQYVDPNPEEETPLLHEFGLFKVLGSGWVKTVEWINAYQKHLLVQEALLPNKLDYAHLRYQEDHWEYLDFQFSNLVCCEGHHYLNNPWFNWLPFKLCKGQVLLIRCPGLNPKYILKRGVYLVHQHNDIYKVGATYEWDFTDDKPSEKGREILLEKLSQMLPLPYDVVDHLAGIRPTTRDRAAIMGKHPENNNLFLFNGLGTKGMLQAPFLAKHFTHHLLDQTPLFAEIDIKRFHSFYFTSQ